MSDGYADRIARLLYARTDEKEIVGKLLRNLFVDRNFRDALDLGAGPGLLTGHLAEVCENLTLVELNPTYEATLREKFPCAKVHIESVLGFPLPTQSYDAILCSQMLYYLPEDEWLPFCRRMIGALRPGGTLYLIVNRDEGEWWEAVSHFWKPLRPHLRFHYRPLSQLRAELAAETPLEEHRYASHIFFDSQAQAVEYIGRQLLQIYEDEVLRQNHQAFVDIARRWGLTHTADVSLLTLHRAG